MAMDSVGMEFALEAREIVELGMLLLQMSDQSHMIYMPIGVYFNLPNSTDLCQCRILQTAVSQLVTYRTTLSGVYRQYSKVDRLLLAFWRYAGTRFAGRINNSVRNTSSKKSAGVLAIFAGLFSTAV